MPLKTSKKNKVAYLHFYAFYVHKKDSIFMRLKTSKEKKVARLTFCAFCAFFLCEILNTLLIYITIAFRFNFGSLNFPAKLS